MDQRKDPELLYRQKHYLEALTALKQKDRSHSPYLKGLCYYRLNRWFRASLYIPKDDPIYHVLVTRFHEKFSRLSSYMMVVIVLVVYLIPQRWVTLMSFEFTVWWKPIALAFFLLMYTLYNLEPRYNYKLSRLLFNVYKLLNTT